ncbi:MAG: hypothetical protein U0989_02085 [Azonexus sp.]|nr:hypothetical protein [Azonexus sp.]MDZ4313557.1 hypothetical protein [Azonexus sp.]
MPKLVVVRRLRLPGFKQLDDAVYYTIDGHRDTQRFSLPDNVAFSMVDFTELLACYFGGNSFGIG